MNDPAQPAPLTAGDTRARFAQHVNPTFARLLGVLGYGRVMVRAQGATLWDDSGKSYVDLLAGFGAFNFGHNHPRLLGALREVLAADTVHLNHTGPMPHAADLCAQLAAAAGPPFAIAMLSSSGAEAVEAALKLARAATRREAIVYCEGGFHGLSLGTLSVMGAPRLRRPFEPLLPGARAVPFGDLPALEQALRKHKPAAFLVEPIQAEAGVILPPTRYLAEAQAACHTHGTLLILDEVQTGLARCGSLFAFQQEQMTPDILVLGKALGGGMAPLAATLASHELHQRALGAMDRFDAHGATYAGNALSCAAGMAALALAGDPALPERAARLGERLLSRLAAGLQGHPLVRGIRGRGLLAGVEFGTTASAGLASLSETLAQHAPMFAGVLPQRFIGQWISLRMLEAGFLCQPASHHWDVLKLEPPLTIDEAELDRATDSLLAILDEYRSLTALVRDVAARLNSQRKKGWTW